MRQPLKGASFLDNDFGVDKWLHQNLWQFQLSKLQESLSERFYLPGFTDGKQLNSGMTIRFNMKAFQ
jgi:hypothetical protein